VSRSRSPIMGAREAGEPFPANFQALNRNAILSEVDLVNHATPIIHLDPRYFHDGTASILPSPRSVWLCDQGTCWRATPRPIQLDPVLPRMAAACRSIP